MTDRFVINSCDAKVLSRILSQMVLRYFRRLPFSVPSINTANETLYNIIDNINNIVSSESQTMEGKSKFAIATLNLKRIERVCMRFSIEVPAIVTD